MSIVDVESVTVTETTTYVDLVPTGKELFEILCFDPPSDYILLETISRGTSVAERIVVTKDPIVQIVTKGIQGPAGPAGIGSEWHQGIGAPASGLGDDNDFYLDTESNDIYEKTSSVWALVGNLSEKQMLASQVDFTNNETIIYRGEALPGTALSAGSWRIRRLTISPDNDVSTQWADGNDQFDNIWDDRLTLSYS